MLTGKNLLNELVDQLNELKLSHMAAKLDSLYHAPALAAGGRKMQSVFRRIDIG